MATPKNNDRIKVNASLSSLEDEGTTREPFRFALSDNKIITFRSTDDLTLGEIQELMALQDADETQALTALSRAFQILLSPEDHETLEAERLPARKATKLFQLVMEYQNESLGESGEEGGSSGS